MWNGDDVGVEAVLGVQQEGKPDGKDYARQAG
jgi:hypothetical protein